MLKTAQKAGVWTRVTYADGENLKKLSDAYVSKVNAYRNDPNIDTKADMEKSGAAFEKAWKAIK